jgi:hypothetical protein
VHSEHSAPGRLTCEVTVTHELVFLLNRLSSQSMFLRVYAAKRSTCGARSGDSPMKRRHVNAQIPVIQTRREVNVVNTASSTSSYCEFPVPQCGCAGTGTSAPALSRLRLAKISVGRRTGDGRRNETTMNIEDPVLVPSHRVAGRLDAYGSLAETAAPSAPRSPETGWGTGETANGFCCRRSSSRRSSPVNERAASASASASALSR